MKARINRFVQLVDVVELATRVASPYCDATGLAGISHQHVHQIAGVGTEVNEGRAAASCSTLSSCVGLSPELSDPTSITMRAKGAVKILA
ncbi:hypothetical protein V6N13_094055 [Hibiscus sabdariffa]